jgi:hypothetical protein
VVSIGVIIILVTIGYFSLPFGSGEIKPVKQGQTVASTEIDTSNWETFTDQELGFSYRHPADCSLNGAGPGTNATNAIGCGGRSFMFYKPLDYSYAKNSPFVNLTLYGAADAYHQVNLLYRQKHGRETGRLGDIVAGILGKNRTYQFTLDAPLEDPCFSDAPGLLYLQV